MSTRSTFDLSHYTSRDVAGLREDIKSQFANPSDELIRDRVLRSLDEQWTAELERRQRQAHRATNEFLFAGMEGARA